jgi:hypothetical protein
MRKREIRRLLTTFYLTHPYKYMHVQYPMSNYKKLNLIINKLKYTSTHKKPNQLSSHSVHTFAIIYVWNLHLRWMLSRWYATSRSCSPTFSHRHRLSMESLSSSYCAHTYFPYSFSTLHICRLVEIRYAHPDAIFSAIAHMLITP